MEVLTAFAAPGHTPWDALITMAICGTLLLLAKMGHTARTDHQFGHIAVADKVLLATTPEQANAIAALGPLPAPRRLGLLALALVSGLALGHASGVRSAVAIAACNPPCPAGQQCHSGLCTGTADARLLSMLYPLPSQAERDVPGDEDRDDKSPLRAWHREPVATDIKFGGGQ